MMRNAVPEDIPVLKKIWKDIFGDTDNFINWFFDNRFTSDMSFVSEINGEIACVIHSYPIKIKLGKKCVSAVMISGVATLPPYRKQGLMHGLFKYATDRLVQNGYYLCYYYPANPDFYKSLGHVNITENLVMNNVYSFYLEKEFTHTPLNSSHIPELKNLYEKFMSEYSGFVTRTNDFETKMQEYISENLQVCLNLNAYIIYHKTESTVEILEIAGRFNRIEELLCSFNLPIKGKLPSNFPTEHLRGSISTAHGNMGGIMNVQKFLEEIGFDCPMLVEITDSIIPHNNGIFDLYGNKHNKKADVTLTSGELLQTVAGYKVHTALEKYFPEHNCFSQDLY